jgi:hypothetical protein
MAYKAKAVRERFLEKVDKGDGCWIWNAARSKAGYGKFVVTKSIGPVGAHRVSYQLFVGEIPARLQVLHRCDNPPCVNPAHLFIGTQADNMRDCHGKGRWKYTPREQRGEKNPNAVLTDEQVTSMLNDLKSGEGPVSVARKYGIHYKTLWAIRKRKTTLH